MQSICLGGELLSHWLSRHLASVVGAKELSKVVALVCTLTASHLCTFCLFNFSPSSGCAVEVLISFSLMM